MLQTVISIANRLVLSSLTLPLLIGVSVILLTLLFFYIKQERSRRWRIEGVLRQQRERERLVAQIAQHIRQSLDLHQVLTTAVAEVQQFLQADRVLIYRLWPDGSGCAINETVLPPFPRILGQSFPEEVFPREYHQAYALGQVRAIGDVDQAQIEDCLVDFVRQFGVRAKLVVPILQEHHDMPTEGKTTPDATSDEPVPHLWGLLIAHQCSGP
ncbi:MAG TPA: GAF domain-containing protein, partial [Stenomitos sp.]